MSEFKPAYCHLRFGTINLREIVCLPKIEDQIEALTHAEMELARCYAHIDKLAALKAKSIDMARFYSDESKYRYVGDENGYAIMQIQWERGVKAREYLEAAKELDNG